MRSNRGSSRQMSRLGGSDGDSEERPSRIPHVPRQRLRVHPAALLDRRRRDHLAVRPLWSHLGEGQRETGGGLGEARRGRCRDWEAVMTYPTWESADDFDGLEDYYAACANAEDAKIRRRS